MKWYNKLLVALVVIAFSPLIILGLILAVGVYLVQIPGNLKTYKNSAYYKEFGLPFTTFRVYSPEFRFFNSFKKRDLPVTYIRQESNGLEYFVYNGTLFLFPDFDQIDYDEEKARWEANFDGDWKDFEGSYAELLAKLDTDAAELPIRLLVERKMLLPYDLNDTQLLKCIFVTRDYDTAFENEDSPGILKVPTDSRELYDMMLATPGLCGDFQMAENGHIHWNLYKNIRIDIDVKPEDYYFTVDKVLSERTVRELTHWHPTVYEVYDEVCRIGMPGNVLMIRTFLGGESVLYMGDEVACPYPPDKKTLFGKIYYLKVN